MRAYTKLDHVTLLLDGVTVGGALTASGVVATFELPYRPGNRTAAARYARRREANSSRA